MVSATSVPNMLLTTPENGFGELAVQMKDEHSM